MSLELLPEVTDAQELQKHRDADERVIREMGDSARGDMTATIMAVCEGWEGMTTKVAVVCNLVYSNRAYMEEMVRKAWEDKSFQTIRQLKALQQPTIGMQAVLSSNFSVLDNNDNAELLATIQAWGSQYIGNTPALLHNIIRRMHENSIVHQSHRYDNMVSIIQGSGTGKSRAADELAKLTFTLPFNIRAKRATMRGAYPHPDEAVRNFFDTHLPTYGTRKLDTALHHCAFLISLFELVTQRLHNRPSYDNPGKVAADWRDYLASNADSGNVVRGSGSSSNSYSHLFTVRDHLYESAFKDSAILRDQLHQEAFKDTASVTHASTLVRRKLEEAAQRLQDAVAMKSKKPERSLVVLYIDEAQELYDLDSEGEYTRFAILCWALDALKHLNVFSIFISTDFNPPSSTRPPEWHPSARISGTTKLQAPITELPFDLLKEPLDAKILTVKDVKTPDFMCHFDRPLQVFSYIRLMSHFTQFLLRRWQTRYDTGISGIKAGIFDFARYKLVGDLENGEPFTPSRQVQELAMLSVRILLNIEPLREDARHLLATLVSNCMATAFSIPAHQKYIKTGYPSEPVLAEGAALAMRMIRRSTRELPSLDTIPSLLSRHVNSGLVTRGEHGELVARLLLTVAHDSAIEFLYPLETFYSNEIPVNTFMEHLFADTHWNTIRKSEPDNCDGASFEAAFKNAGDESGATTMAAQAAFIRGMAIQCYPGQKSIDIVLPVVLDSSQTLREDNISGILISVKNRRMGSSPVSVEIDEELISFFPNADSRPYAAIVLDLGIEDGAGVHVKQRSARQSPRTQSEVVHPRYHIHVIGCSSTVFRVVENKDLYAKLLGSRRVLDEHPRQDDECLDAVRQMKPFFTMDAQSYGWMYDSTREPSHRAQRDTDNKLSSGGDVEMKSNAG